MAQWLGGAYVVCPFKTAIEKRICVATRETFRSALPQKTMKKKYRLVPTFSAQDIRQAS